MKHGAEGKGGKRGKRVNGKDVKRDGEERVLPAHARRANAMKCVSVYVIAGLKVVAYRSGGSEG